MRTLRISAAIIALILQSGCGGLPRAEPPAPASDAVVDHLALHYEDLRKPAASEEFESLETRASVATSPLLNEYAFLRLRPGQKLWKGIRVKSGKGESRRTEECFLAAEGKLFELGLRGTAEFVHFDWEVSTENAERLFRGVVGHESHDVFILTVEQYTALEKRVGRHYPKAVVRRQDLTLSPAQLIRQDGREYVHCEAVIYIQNGKYYPEGQIENAVVKYSTNLGSGLLETEIEVLIRGPYETDPLYWGGINGMQPPPDKDRRRATLRRFEQMNEFNAFIDKFLIEIGVVKGSGRVSDLDKSSIPATGGSNGASPFRPTRTREPGHPSAPSSP